MSLKSKLGSRKALAAIAIGAVLGVPAVTVPLAVTATAASAPSTQYKNLTKEQLDNAKTIIATTKKHGFSTRAMEIAIATALQESTLRNLNHGDRDSVGLFQQRTSTGWGTIAQIRNPVLSTEAFLGVAKHTKNPGLKDIKGWEKMPLTKAAQAVQRSGFPNAYAKWEPLAKEIVARNNPKSTPKPTVTGTPTKSPTKSPTAKPTATKSPTKSPTGKPSASGTPTKSPTAKSPTAKPTATKSPTGKPTASPSLTKVPTAKPTATQTPRQTPTAPPTFQPPTLQPPVTEPPVDQTPADPPADPPVDQPGLDQPPSDAGVGGDDAGVPVGDSKDAGGSTGGDAPLYPESSGGLASTGS